VQPRLRRVASVHDLDAAVDEYRFRGYRTLRRNDDKALLQKVDKGTVGMHVVLAMFTLGVGNLIYAVAKQSRADQVLIRVDGD
jgi:hypothetical protein